MLRDTIDVRIVRRMRRSGHPACTLAGAMAASVLLLAACGEAAPSADGAGDDTSAETASEVVEAPDADVASTPPAADVSDEASSTAPEPADDADGEGEADLCTELAAFLDDWVRDEIGPADLTSEYLRLADIAPSELADDFRVLAEGNEEALESGGITDQDGYDASGAAVQNHAMDACGIELAG